MNAETTEDLSREFKRTQYFVWIGEGAEGPFDGRQLIQMATQGQINAATPAMIDGHSDWRTVGDFVPLSGRAAWPASRIATVAISLAVVGALLSALVLFPGKAMTAVFIAVGASVYFLPTMLAAGKQNRAAIFTLNLLAGWTFIGWVVSMVWAVTKDRS